MIGNLRRVMTNDRPTLDTVAAAAGVSRMTVSNAYGRPDQLSPATRERVLEVADRLGYPGPDPGAQSLRRGRTGTVGVVLTERLPFAFTDPGLMTILHGIATELSAAANALLLVPSNTAEGESLVRRAIVDALVLCAVSPQDPAVTAALARQLPVVTVGHPRLAGVPCVGVDNEVATAQAAAHLLDLGHSRFCVLTLSPDDTGPAGRSAHLGIRERAPGFARALAAAGVDPRRVTTRRALENTRPAAAAALAELLGQPAARRPTALFAVTDVLALGAIDAAAAHGVTVPAALSVVGFDDIADAANSTPPLTTVSQGLFHQGQVAARLALRRLAGEQVRSPRLTAELVVRGSTARPPGCRKGPH
jgi:DNA-binding LacI/PurR family transcriptional regulator